MESLTIIAVIAIALVAALLIGIVLIQQSKGGGFGVAFGGIGETVFGAHAAGHLVKITVTLMVLFFVLIIGMAVLIARGKPEKSMLELIDGGEARAAIAADTMPVITAVTPDTASTK